MNLLVIGLNYKTTSVDVRECISLNDAEIASALKTIKSYKGIKEVAILSTCNRVDVIVVTTMPQRSQKDIERFLNQSQKAENKIDIQQHLYTYLNSEAIRYFFRVTASLDSMIIGEPQIIGQVKNAYRAAVEMDTAGYFLNKLFHKAFFAAKKVRNETCISENAISVSYAAVELASNILGPLQDKSTLLIGAGEMAELALKHFINKGVSNIFVANRTYDHLINCTRRYNATPVDFSNLLKVIKEVDIVLSSTGASEFIVSENNVRSIFPIKPQKPLLFIDIAVPRDIDPLVSNVEDVFVYDIDDLQDVVKTNFADRKREAQKAESIITDSIMNFNKWHRSQAIVPTIIDLRKKFEDITREQGEKILRTHHSMPADYDTYKKMVDRIVNNLLHNPIYYLKQKYCFDNDPLPLKIVREMFKLDSNDP